MTPNLSRDPLITAFSLVLSLLPAGIATRGLLAKIGSHSASSLASEGHEMRSFAFALSKVKDKALEHYVFRLVQRLSGRVDWKWAPSRTLEKIEPLEPKWHS